MLESSSSWTRISTSTQKSQTCCILRAGAQGAAEDTSPSMRQTIQRIAQQLASVVYNGDSGIKQQGWRPADVSTIT